MMQTCRLFEKNLGEYRKELRRTFSGIGIDGRVVVEFDLLMQAASAD